MYIQHSIVLINCTYIKTQDVIQILPACPNITGWFWKIYKSPNISNTQVQHCIWFRWPAQKHWRCSTWTCSPISPHSFLLGVMHNKLSMTFTFTHLYLLKKYGFWKLIICRSGNNHLNQHHYFILPSVELSQKHVLAVCRPAPFFCMMIQVTVGKKYIIFQYQPHTAKEPS